MQAAAMVLRREIVSIYPSLNGFLNWCIGIFSDVSTKNKKNWTSSLYNVAVHIILRQETYGLQFILFHYLFILIRCVYVNSEQSEYLVDVGFENSHWQENLIASVLVFMIKA